MCSRRRCVSCVVVHGRDRLAGDRHGTARRPVEPGEDVHQRRLARARRPHHRGQLAGFDLERDAPQRLDRGLARAVAASQVERDDHRLGGTRRGNSGANGSARTHCQPAVARVSRRRRHARRLYLNKGTRRIMVSSFAESSACAAGRTLPRPARAAPVAAGRTPSFSVVPDGTARRARRHRPPGRSLVSTHGRRRG